MNQILMGHELETGNPYNWPQDILTERIAMIGQTGMGKTHTEGVFQEGLMELGLPFAILDLPGHHIGIRAPSASLPPDKAKAYPVIILGGERGDIAITPEDGEAVAHAFIETNIPICCDLMLLHRDEQADFVEGFCRELFLRSRSPRHLFIEEADLVCPQRGNTDVKGAAREVDQVVRRARGRGVGVTVATQRIAVIDKSTIEQCTTLVVHGLTGPRDREHVEAWVASNANWNEVKDILDELPMLEPGVAWVWSPRFLGHLKKIRVRERYSYHAGRTPKVGEPMPQPAFTICPDRVRIFQRAFESALAELPKKKPRAKPTPEPEPETPEEDPLPLPPEPEPDPPVEKKVSRRAQLEPILRDLVPLLDKFSNVLHHECIGAKGLVNCPGCKLWKDLEPMIARVKKAIEEPKPAEPVKA